MGAMFLPNRTAITAPFWDGVERGVLTMQWCSACARSVFYPRAFCHRCGSEHLEWRAHDGEGTLVAYTVVHRAPRDFQSFAPYAVGIGDFSGGRMFGVLLECEGLRSGCAIRFIGRTQADERFAGMPTPYFFKLAGTAGP
jgi:uncharacterized OB-fold protein